METFLSWMKFFLKNISWMYSLWFGRSFELLCSACSFWSESIIYQIRNTAEILNFIKGTELNPWILHVFLRKSLKTATVTCTIRCIVLNIFSVLINVMHTISTVLYKSNGYFSRLSFNGPIKICLEQLLNDSMLVSFQCGSS